MAAQTRQVVVTPPVPPGGWFARSGVVIAELSETVVDTSVNSQQAEWSTRRRQVPIDPSTGSVTLTLVCTDDAAIQPTGATWKVWWVIDGQASPITPYTISTSLAASVNLSSLTPAASTDPGGPSGPTSVGALLAAGPPATPGTTAGQASVDSNGVTWIWNGSGWVQASPSEIAYAANVTGTTTALVGGADVDIPSLAISVPASARPVWIRAAAVLQQTAAGTGNVLFDLVETTSGNFYLATFAIPTLPNIAAGNGAFFRGEGSYRLGATAAARTFKLSLKLDISSSTPTVVAVNSATLGSLLTAEAK